MVTKTINACLYIKTLEIGRQMENNYRQIIFDCSGFGEDIAEITLVHQRSKDEAPYIVTTSDSETLTWNISDTDTAYAGLGQAELRISFASGLAKSIVYATHVIESITGDTEIPEPLHSWYDAMIEYIDDHAATPEQIEAAVEAYLEDHPIPAPVQSVNGKTGDVVLSYVDVGAIAVETDPLFTSSPVYGITSADIVSWNGKSDFSGSYNDLTNKPTIPTAVSQLDNDAGYITSAPVTSVNSKTGAVVISASDLGAYVKPSGGIPKSDLASAVQTSLSKADSALQTAPVTSVNTKTGAVTLTANDVGALPSTYTAPVQSVDGKTGAVQIMPTGGTTGQVLTKTASGTAWQTVSGGGAVDSVNGQTGTVVLDADDVGALPDTTVIPTKTSDLTNDSGFITSADDVFWCTFGTTTSAEIEAAIASGQLPCVLYNDYVYVLAFRNSATNHRFVCFYGGKEKSIACQSGTWIPNGDLTFLTTSYTPPVTSVNGQTGAVSLSIPTVPTNVSAFTNDAGYLTQHQSLTAYQTKAITDTGGYFTTDTVEGALQEIGAEIAGINTLIGTGVIS